MLVPLLGTQMNGCMRRTGGWRGQSRGGNPSSPAAAGFSTKNEDAGGRKEEEEEEKNQEKQQQEEEEPETEGPPEDGEKIGFMRGLAYLTVAVIAAGSLYFIVDELMPSRTSANHLFNEAFDAVKQNHDVLNRYGEPLKGYGRDGGDGGRDAEILWSIRIMWGRMGVRGCGFALTLKGHLDTRLYLQR